MVDLPKLKVGIVACSGEELPEGTITRLAALRVLEELRPGNTVTICLPLFLAGGEGDRAFARFYPTIAIDGCEKLCAARATEKYSNKPAASVMVRDLIHENDLDAPEGRRRLNAAGLQAVDITATRVAGMVDGLLQKHWSRRTGQLIQVDDLAAPEPVIAACACGSGIPVQTVNIEGSDVLLIALPLIFEQFHEAGKPPVESTLPELIETIKIYNPLPSDAETTYASALLHEYTKYCKRKEPGS